MTVINEKTEKIIYQNNWITNHEITEKIVEKIVKSARSRWKVENEGNNVPKHHVYNLEPNFGHEERLRKLGLRGTASYNTNQPLGPTNYSQKATEGRLGKKSRLHTKQINH